MQWYNKSLHTNKLSKDNLLVNSTVIPRKHMKRTCPCCNAEITFRYFFKHLKNRRKNFFVENEVGLLCPSCKTSIISAERKNKEVTFTMMFSMFPIVIFGFSGEFALTWTWAIKFIFWMSMSFLVFVLALYRIHQKIEYICNDENSDEYNEYEQLTGITKHWKQ